MADREIGWGSEKLTRLTSGGALTEAKKLHCKRAATHYFNLDTLSFQSSTGKALPLLHSPVMLDTGLGITSKEILGRMPEKVGQREVHAHKTNEQK